MIYFPEDNILTTDGDYTPFRGYGAGRPVSIELTGTFDGATVLLGFTSSDDDPVFVEDLGSDNASKPQISPVRMLSLRPASGKPAIRVSNAGGSTAILVKITDLLPR